MFFLNLSISHWRVEVETVEAGPVHSFHNKVFSSFIMMVALKKWLKVEDSSFVPGYIYHVYTVIAIRKHIFKVH